MASEQLNSYESQKLYLLENAPADIKRYIVGNVKGLSPLLTEQQDVLKDYYIYLVTESTITTKYHSYLNHLAYMYRLARFVNKPFNEVSKDDIKAYFFSIHNKNGKEGTLNQYRMVFRTFFKFLYGTKDLPEIVSWIKLAKKQKKELTPDELLSRTDVRNMIDSASTPRDKAIIAVLFESAARRNEILSCDIGHVMPDKYGIRLKLPESKTKVRTVRLIESVPYLQTWVNNHPNKDNPNAPLFVSLCKDYGSRFKHGGFVDLIKRTAKHAKIHKKVNPHLFRHSRLDLLAREGFNERDLKLIAGWSDSSDMPSVYLHYGEKELDQKLLQKCGKIDRQQEMKEEQEKTALKPINCPRCSLENGPGSKYCGNCGMALNLKDFMKDQETIQEEADKRLKVYADIMADPEKRQKFEEFKKIFFS